jgi:predicted membrane-bound spermidine synthase
VFFVSGIAAIIYQIVWQRRLLSWIGVNIESITLVVSLFMAGLGVGALIGGFLSKKFAGQAIRIFVAIEMGIGFFGIFSLSAIDATGRAVQMQPGWVVAIAVWLLLLLPTMLMGATLPVLFTHLDRHLNNVGQTIRHLYVLTTLGSALACFLVVGFLFVYFGLRHTAWIAAGLNFLVAAYAAIVSRQSVESP